MSRKITCIVLAAGAGSRMKSDIPKPLHKIAGKPMVLHVIEACEALNPEKIITVLSPDTPSLEQAVSHHGIAYQPVANGTGGAALAAIDFLEGVEGDVLVVFGDTPLITTDALQKSIDKKHADPKTGVVCSGFKTDDPTGYGRLDLNTDGSLRAVIEHKDASDEQRKINLCNGGIMCVEGTKMVEWLSQVGNNNAQGEYYLVDLPVIAAKDSYKSEVCLIDEEDTVGVNSRSDQARAEQLLQNRLRRKHMDNGVTLIDPKSVYFSVDTHIEQDVITHPHVVFGPEVVIQTGVEIHAFSHIEQALVRRNASVGPYARLRPGADIGEDAKVGNFVEIKKTKLGRGSKASHLTYLGDAFIGTDVNIGAGTITCNYDGFNKFETRIDDGAFVGSNTALVAPVEIGKGAIVAAGSTITKDVSKDSLAFGRAKQTVKQDWAVKFRDKQEKK